MTGKIAPPPAVSFVAESGTGKTALVESLITELCRRGRRIGAVKHTSHEIEIDREGKDSWRLARAGASTVVLSSPREIAVMERGLEREVPLMGILSRFMGEADLVLVEGYKSGPLPKIEIHRSGRGKNMICLGKDGRVTDASLIAVVSDEDLDLPVPVLPLTDAAAVCDFLEARFFERDTGEGTPPP